MKTLNFMKKEKTYEKTYPAEVVDNVDPLGIGRIKVKVPALMGETAFFVMPEFINSSIIMWYAPDIGDIVKVKFMNDDIDSGVWYGGMPGGMTLAEFIDQAAQADVWGFRDKEGNTIRIDRPNGIVYVNGVARIHLNAPEVLITAANSATIQTQLMTIDSPETVITGNLTVNQNATIDANFTVTGTSTLKSTCTFEDKAWLSHKHSGVQTGGGTSGGIA